MTIAAWQRELFTLGSARFRAPVALRFGVAVGLPLAAGLALGAPGAGVIAAFAALLTTICDVGDTHRARFVTMTCGALGIVAGGVLGAHFGDHPYAHESLVTAAALAVGLLSGPHPALSVVARFFALAVVVGAGVEWHSTAFFFAGVGGVASALLVTALTWALLPRDRTNPVDWRTRIDTAFAFDRPDIRYALALTVAAAAALFAANLLALHKPYWAAVTVLMVMRREGTESLRLTLHYAVGTLLGLVAAAACVALAPATPALAAIAIATAAVTRIALAINPSLGFASFTIFVLLLLEVGMPHTGFSWVLWSTRAYDVAVGCALAILGTLAARRTAPTTL
ncbi:MAG: FUSC family protein [Proteobacteria bacterium]|nr:FUSC family protein [Pseudomonadota bacterium]